MTRRELDAAGITDPRLRASYARCRALNARHGRTYFLATRLLEPWRRPAVHALYGFARYADDIVDEPGAEREPDRIAARLTAVAGALDAGLRSGRSGHPVLAAVVDTAGRYGIDAALFAAFLRSMRMDLTVTDYPTRDALREYMYGSAEVIGLQMLPVLGTVGDPAEAAPHAAALGQAFQLTNFLRDVAEDLDRGRVYLPADELAAHGVDRDVLGWCRRTGRVDARTRRALADQVARTRAVYRRARPGIALLQPASRPCIATAYALYAGILDGIEARDHNVFGGRVTVGRGRRTALAGAAFTRVLWARARAAANGGAASGDVRRAGGGRAGERRSGEGLAGERHAGERHTGEGPVGDRRARNAPGPSASVPGGPTRAGNETSVPDKTVAPAPGRRTAPGSGGRAAPGSGGRAAPGSGGRAGPPGLRAGPASGGRGDAGPGGSIGPDGNTPHPGRGHGASGKD